MFEDCAHITEACAHITEALFMDGVIIDSSSGRVNIQSISCQKVFDLTKTNYTNLHFEHTRPFNTALCKLIQQKSDFPA